MSNTFAIIGNHGNDSVTLKSSHTFLTHPQPKEVSMTKSNLQLVVLCISKWECIKL